MALNGKYHIKTLALTWLCLVTMIWGCSQTPQEPIRPVSEVPYKPVLPDDSTLHFKVLDGSERVKGMGVWDERPGGVYVAEVVSRAPSVRALYDSVRKKYTNGVANTSLSNPLMVIGRLPGDGLGPNASFITKIVSEGKIERKGNVIQLSALCAFEGPFDDSDPMPQAIYFTGNLPQLAPGQYTIKMKIIPEGEVYEVYSGKKPLIYKDPQTGKKKEWWNDPESEDSIKLPMYPPMECKFQVAERSEPSTEKAGF